MGGNMDSKEFEKLSKGAILDKLNSIEPSFWMHNPDIILFMIRMVIWLNSTEIGTTLFYVFTYGLDNCYIKRRSWIQIVINTALTLLVAAHCSVNVIPLYSLTSNLGSHQTPREVTMALFVPERLATVTGAKQRKKDLGKV